MKRATVLGFRCTSSDNDQFTKIAEAQLLPTTENGSTLCRNIHPSRARVLPKCHTAQTGLTIRSFSHFIALASSSEVRPEWITDEVERGGYGLFTFDALGQPSVKALRKLVDAAEETVGRIDGMIFPEVALDPKSVTRISNAFVREDRFLIAGVGRPASVKAAGENYIRFDVMLPGGEYLPELVQNKHHRWKLEKTRSCSTGSDRVLTLRPTGGNTSMLTTGL